MFDLQLLSQCGSTQNCLSRSVPEIHSHVAGALSNQQTTTTPNWVKGTLTNQETNGDTPQTFRVTHRPKSIFLYPTSYVSVQRQCRRERPSLAQKLCSPVWNLLNTKDIIDNACFFISHRKQETLRGNRRGRRGRRERGGGGDKLDYRLQM